METCDILLSLKEEEDRTVELQDLSSSTIAKVESVIEASESGSKDRKVQDTLSCLRYLKKAGSARRSDFVDNCFDGEGSKEGWWKRAREGMHELSDEIGELEVPGKGHSVYRWE